VSDRPRSTFDNAEVCRRGAITARRGSCRSPTPPLLKRRPPGGGAFRRVHEARLGGHRQFYPNLFGSAHWKRILESTMRHWALVGKSPKLRHTFQCAGLPNGMPRRRATFAHVAPEAPVRTRVATRLRLRAQKATIRTQRGRRLSQNSAGTNTAAATGAAAAATAAACATATGKSILNRTAGPARATPTGDAQAGGAPATASGANGGRFSRLSAACAASPPRRSGPPW